MKLIVEEISSVEYLDEEVNGKKSLFIEGPFLVGETVNKNGRVYPMKLLDREVTRYTKECIDNNCAWGQLDHPNVPNVQLQNVALKVVSLKPHGNAYIGKAKITESQTMGKLAAGLIREEGANLGVSSRGVGSLKEHPKGYKEVQEDFMLCVAADLVSNPSAPGAFVKGIMEDAEWILDAATGEWRKEIVHESKKFFKEMSKSEREANALRLFETFLSEIASK